MPGIQLDSNVSTGPVVAADSQGSTMYPLSKLAFGAIGTFTLVTDDTAGAFPIKNVTDTGRPLVVRGLTDSTVAVSGTVTVSNIDANDTVVTVTNIADNDTVVTVTGPLAVTTDTNDLIRIGNDTGQAVTVRGPTDSTVVVSGTVTVANIDANDTVVTVTNIADNDTVVRVTGDTATPIPVRGLTDSVVDVRVKNDSATLTYFASASSSAAVLVKNSPGYLWGYHIFNPDTDDKIYVHLFNDTDVTLGTDSALLTFGFAPMAAANVAFTKPIPLSAGLSISVAATPNSTSHDTPGTGAVVNLYYE